MTKRPRKPIHKNQNAALNHPQIALVTRHTTLLFEALGIVQQAPELQGPSNVYPRATLLKSSLWVTQTPSMASNTVNTAAPTSFFHAL